MFQRGRFAFDTRGPNTIRLELLGEVDTAGGADGKRGMVRAMDRVRELLESRQMTG